MVSLFSGVNESWRAEILSTVERRYRPARLEGPYIEIRSCIFHTGEKRQRRRTTPFARMAAQFGTPFSSLRLLFSAASVASSLPVIMPRSPSSRIS